MDVEVAALLQRVKEAGRAPFWQSTPELARNSPTLMSLLFGEAPHVDRIEALHFQSLDGADIPARLYVPGGTSAGLIVFFHGGGWVIGSVADYHPFAATLAQRTACAVLSVDYRLSPEHPFPLPVEDAQAALRFAARTGARLLGGEPRVLIAMGDSAGATLATVATRLHRCHAKLRQVDLQVLAYPVADADFETGSYREFEQGYLLTRKDMQWFWQQYCPSAELRNDPNASPMRSKYLHCLPPTLVLTAGLDPLRDEGESYGRCLAEAGVRAEVVRCEGLPHGFLAMINYAPSASRAFDRAVRAIASAEPLLEKS